MLHNFIKQLSLLPGIGPKTAQRLAYHMLDPKNKSNALQLSNIIEQAMTQIKPCLKCFDLTDQSICMLCQSPKRNQEQLCIVAYPQDIISIEQSQSYQGRYFVLMGLLSPLDGIGPDDINIKPMLEYLNSDRITEVILAIQSSVEGQATSYYIAQQLSNMNISVTQLAHGIPMGGELEYMDSHTIHQAFSARNKIDEIETF